MNIGDIIYAINNAKLIERNIWYHKHIINGEPIPEEDFYKPQETKKDILEIDSFFFKRLKFLSQFVHNAEELLTIAKANHIVSDEVAKAVVDLYNNNTENIYKK